MCMMDEIRAKRDEIYAIARRHKVEKLWVFGSCARKKEPCCKYILDAKSATLSHRFATEMGGGLVWFYGRVAEAA